MSRHRQTWIIVWLAAILIAAFAFFVRVSPWRAELAEASSQGNLIRLQAFLFDPPPRAVLVGSSISGRLLPAYFTGTTLGPVANLGLDGSGALFGLDVVRRKAPPLVLIEENRMLKPWDSNEETLGAMVESVSFRAARAVPILRAQFRPSSVIYSWLKLRRNTASSSSTIGIGPSAATASAAGDVLATRDATLRLAHDKLYAQIKTLRTNGSRVVLLRMPAGAFSLGTNSAAALIGDELAAELDLVQLDLSAECARRGHALQYTDGLHLTPSSASAISQLIAELVTEKAQKGESSLHREPAARRVADSR